MEYMVRTSLDELRPAEEHLAILAKDLRVVFCVWIFITAILAFFSKEIIDQWMKSLGPFIDGSTVYSPERWLRLRWGIVLLVGMLVVAPYFLYMVNRFTRPGLLPKERLLMSSASLFTIFFLWLGLPTFWIVIGPYILTELDALNTVTGMSNQYDISIIFESFLGISWALLCTILGVMARIAISVTHHKEHDNRMSLDARTVFFTGFLLYISLNGPLTGLWLPLIIFTIILMEAMTMSVTNSRIEVKSPRSVLDAEGAINRITILDCSCEGACPKLSSTPNGCGLLRTEALCLNNLEADRLLESLQHQETTRLIITGCDGTPLPFHIQESIISLGVEVIGLSWLDHRGHHPEDTSMATMYRNHTLMNASNIENIQSDVDTLVDPGWGRYIPRGVIALPVSYEEGS